jgi:hypothetical protein
MRREKLKFCLAFSFLVVVLVLMAPSARAASLFLSPASGQAPLGQDFEVSVRVNSSDQGFNAAQATIQFPADILQAKSIDSSPGASIFNFWLTGPSFSNSTGRITFLGGTTDGVVGASIQILKITFTAKSAGQAVIAVSDAAITASDGSGTNILESVANANFSINPVSSTPEASTSTIATTAPPAKITPPNLITRQPTVASQTPALPELNIALYPDSAKWSNQISDFLIKWKLPGDISGISAVINKNAKASPPAVSEGLYDAKVFPALSDGIWYAHARLQNNIGWSPTAHYKIAIDTVPPLPFVVESPEGAVTGNPAPILNFKTSDGLSGLSHYTVRVDNSEELTVSDSASALPLQTPGKKHIIVRAVDNAGNIRESSLDLEILPIASPVISAINKEALANESDLAVSGTALPNVVVWLALKSEMGAVAAKIKTSSDAQGNWGTQFSGPFKQGTYFVEAIAQDERGALSFPVKTGLFKIKAKPLLIIGGLAITQLWFFIGLITVLLLAFTAGWWAYHLWREQIVRKSVIAQRDIINVFALLEKDLNGLSKIYAKTILSKADKAKIKFILKAMKSRLSTAQKYIVDNVKEIGE